VAAEHGRSANRPLSRRARIGPPLSGRARPALLELRHSCSSGIWLASASGVGLDDRVAFERAKPHGALERQPKLSGSNLENDEDTPALGERNATDRTSHRASKNRERSDVVPHAWALRPIDPNARLDRSLRRGSIAARPSRIRRAPMTRLERLAFTCSRGRAPARWSPPEPFEPTDHTARRGYRASPRDHAAKGELARGRTRSSPHPTALASMNSGADRESVSRLDSRTTACSCRRRARRSIQRKSSPAYCRCPPIRPPRATSHSYRAGVESRRRARPRRECEGAQSSPSRRSFEAANAPALLSSPTNVAREGHGCEREPRGEIFRPTITGIGRGLRFILAPRRCTRCREPRRSGAA